MAQYYKSLQYDTVGGEEYNIEILDYLRDHIRTNNRDQYIENLCRCDPTISSPVGLTQANNLAQFFRNKNFTATGLRASYDASITVKNNALKLLIEKYEALPDKYTDN